MKPESYLLPAMLAAALALSACKQKNSQESADIRPEAKPVAVKTATARAEPVARSVRVTGELKAATDSQIAANATGRVVETRVERGSAVKAGDIIAILDTRTIVLSLREAEATVLQARSALALSTAELERNIPLAKAKAVSDTDLQKLRTENDSRKASLAVSEARRDKETQSLQDAEIRAPFTGTIAERLVETGSYVTPNLPVARLVDTSHLRLVIDVPEPVVGQLHSGQRVDFTVSAFPGVTFPATLQYLGPALRTGSRDVQVEAVVDNSDHKLLPGMFAEGRLMLAEEPGIVVPESALRSSGSLTSILVITEGRAIEHIVEPGGTNHSWVEIHSGIKAGETVVVNPPADLTDGTPVQPSAS
jgi:membrane fusion protein (multidrug efflux system)